jgi:hypothetical protein
VRTPTAKERTDHVIPQLASEPPILSRGQRKNKRRGSLRAAKYRLNLEALENRSLPTFLAPVNYAVDTNSHAVATADWYVANLD